MSRSWLHLRFSAPMMSFGGVAIDHVGPTRDFPSASAITGLVGNALGYRREDGTALQDLQNRLIFGALIVQQGRVLTDTQNAKLEKNDKGWTTLGTPDERAGATYDSPHRRRRDYLVDHECRVVLHVPDTAWPRLSDIAHALDYPARPLFFGRKPCLPSGPVYLGEVQAATPKEAFAALGLSGRAIWPAESAESCHDLADLRNWVTGYHAGTRRVTEEYIG